MHQIRAFGPVKRQGSKVFFPSPNLHRATHVTRGSRHALIAFVMGPA